jgi:hypothetical protein
MAMPEYAQNALYSSGAGGMGGMGGAGGMIGSGIGGLLGGLFGDSGAPYGAAMDEYERWANKAQGVQNPFLQAGTGAIPQYQEWLNKMKDPSGFMNNLMGNYQQSPYARYLTNQSLHAGQNAASASGLSGSTPFLQQMQQNAGNISSGDMNNWLQKALGINSQYGQGVGNMMNMGQNSANALTNMYGDMGKSMGEAAYGQKAGQNGDFWNAIGGGAQLAAGLLML